MKQSGKNLTAEKNLKVIVDLVEAQKAPDSRAIGRNEDIRKFPGSFFETTAVQLEDRVLRYKKTISVCDAWSRGSVPTADVDRICVVPWSL